ncbi:unnamed protein product [Cuscuta europaea]|uniref:Uncharacterized protein n=1 Tax=Cuscuta europaea TaxID=41803 RepID=A0A9P1E869_CUSEU|nr:unnamed protein product [Cuscuta europaea]
MAAFLRAKLSSFAASHSTINALLSQSQRFTLNAGGFCRGLASKSSQQTATKSPFNSNLLRILHNEIDYLCAYAPSQPIAATFNDFTVEDHPAEQWVTLKRKFQDDEDIKIEATMFDGSVPIAPKSGDESNEDVRLHISLLVDIWKKGGCDSLEFVCSAWPDSLEVQSVYIFKREGLQLSQPYMGPNVKMLFAGCGVKNSYCRVVHCVVFIFNSKQRIKNVINHVISLSSGFEQRNPRSIMIGFKI